ncbi:MAG: FxLYD domain-containing protein [Clostridia bacterium]|nr:FxLYD domain-containing protein [Clostridia bacterium]
MDTLKKFAKYIIWIVLFYFFSNILIFVGLNSNYNTIRSSENTPSQVQIEQSEATLVNGRIKGKITNDGEEDLNGKYMKVDLYSPRNTLLGTDYLEIKDLNKGETDDFELFFKAQDVDHYDISFVDKPDEKKGLKESLKDDMKWFWKRFKINTEFMDRKLTGEELVYLLILLALLG